MSLFIVYESLHLLVVPVDDKDAGVLATEICIAGRLRQRQLIVALRSLQICVVGHHCPACLHFVDSVRIATPSFVRRVETLPLVHTLVPLTATGLRGSITTPPHSSLLWGNERTVLGQRLRASRNVT